MSDDQEIMRQIVLGLQGLRVRLEEADKFFRERDDGGRLGAIAALDAVVEFLDSVSFDVVHRRALRSLLDELRELNEGVQGPLLRPAERPRRGRGEIPFSVKFSRMWAALALDFLIKSGMPVKEATSKVARKVSSWELPNVGKVNAVAVKKWREHLAEEYGMEGEVGAIYKEYVDRAKVEEWDYARVAKTILESGSLTQGRKSQ